MVRKPGQGFDLTEEEILAAPVKLLTPQQRRHRRLLRGKERKRRMAMAKAKRIEQERAQVIMCQARKRDHTPCQAHAMEGAKHCRHHLNDAERAKLELPTKAQERESRRNERLFGMSVNGRKLNAPQSAKQIMEVALSSFFQRYFKALGLRFEGYDEDGQPVVYDEGFESGLCLYGESKDGYVNVTNHPDLMAQIQVMEKLWDRVYGKARQTTVLEGGKVPIQVKPVRTVERAQGMASLLHRSGAFGTPHEGRRRAEGVEGETEKADATDATDTGNVVPLRPDEGES